MADPFNPGVESVAQTASPNIQTVQARNDPNGSVNSLLTALGSESTQRELANFNAKRDMEKQQEQAIKLESYTQQFMQDHGGGAVSQAQIKGKFPELVPVIAARVAESIGKRQGEQDFAKIIDQVNADDSLRLDTAKRNAFLAKARTELFGSIQQGNEFYSAGVVSAMDKQVAQQELKWQGQTAQYHELVQKEALSKEVTDAFNGGDPKAALEGIDANWGKSSSLNPLERNKIVVASAIDTAFANDDAKVLSSVPTRFLNADSKAALEKAKVQLTDRRMTDFRNVQYLQEVQRTEGERKGKVDIITAHADGAPADPAQYRDNPSLYAFALSQREAGRVPEAQSAGATQMFETKVWTDAASGAGKPMKDYIDEIVADRSINPADKKGLISRMEKLMEGTQVMKDDLVRQTFTDRIGPSIHAMEQSPAFGILTRAGRNLRSEVVKSFDTDLRRAWQAEFEETGAYPKGHRKQELVDKATDAAEARIVKAMDTRNAVAEAKAAKSGAAPAAPAATPTAAKALSPIQAAIAAELAKRPK